VQSAIVTASYRGDLERCRLLCESMDRRVTGHTRHLILVEAADGCTLRQFAGPKREIIDERALLPAWLRPFPDPTSLGRRRIWLSPKGPPLRGWHVQQLRRIAIGAALVEAAMISVDSDVVFLRIADVGWFSEAGKVKFYRKPGAAAEADAQFRDVHRHWSRKAAELLGIASPATTETGYIATLIAWRSDTVREMVRRIEEIAGRSWMGAIAATRTLSECMIYGRFVDEVENRPDRHAVTDLSLCQMYWSGRALGAEALRDFAGNLLPHHVAAGIQSFTETDPALIRRAAGLA